MKNTYKKLYAVLGAAAVWFCIASCGDSSTGTSTIPERKLTLVSEIVMPFGELSGIAYSESLRKLWVISGGTQHIYRLDVSGNVEHKLNFTGGDLEGIAFDASDSTLWTIDEGSKVITHLDLAGNVLAAHQLSYTTTTNKGPEGITIGKQHAFYILNERNPSILARLDSQMTISKIYELNFAADYSDVSFDSGSGSFLILSDENGAFFEWSEEHGVLTRYPLINTGNEGIAFDRLRHLYYITNKNTDRLYIYSE